MPINRRISDPPRKPVKPFPLSRWYPSTDLKTYLGPVVSRLSETTITVGALGTKECPLIELSGYVLESETAAVPITVEEARDAWSELTAAVVYLGVPFIVSRRGEEAAVIRRHPENRHKAFDFAHQYHEIAGPQDDTTLLQALEAQTAAFKDMAGQLAKIGQSQEILYRIAVKVWRREEGYDTDVIPPRVQAH